MSDFRPCPPMKASQRTTQGDSTLEFSVTVVLTNASQTQHKRTGPSTTQGPNPIHSRQREPLQMTGLKAKTAQPQQQDTCTTHMRHPEAPWSGDEGTLHYRGPQDFSFIRTQFQLSEQVSDLEHRVMENKEAKREEQQEY